MTTTFSSWVKRIDWVTTLFLFLTPVAAAVLVPICIATQHTNPWIYVVAVVYLYLTGMSITGGYHRLFAHRSYEASKLVQAVYLMLGAATFQGSALKWCSDHRRHHRFEDTDRDPYNINKGFWYAHIGWMLVKDESIHQKPFAPDLQKNKLVMLQHNHYVWFALAFGFGLPILLGWALGSAFAGLVYIGFVRLVVSHHVTFFINSLCHMIGRRPYCEGITARDSFFLAVLTYGEGYHNYHHKFETDYRNGPRWYNWDPTKWLIRSLALFGLAHRLNRVSPNVVLRARLQRDERRLLARGVSAENLTHLRERVEEAQKRVRALYEEYEKLKTRLRQQSQGKLEELRQDFARSKAEIKIAKAEFRAAFEVWSLQF